MTTGFANKKFKALPFQVIENDKGIILKRGVAQIAIGGKQASAVIATMLAVLGEHGATLDEVCATFAEPDRPGIKDLLRHLVNRRFLVAADQVLTDTEPASSESNLDVFYWQFGRQTAQVVDTLNTYRTAIVGVNLLSQRMVAALTAVGVTTIHLIDDPLLRNPSLYTEDGNWRAEEWPATLAPPVPAEDWQQTLSTADVRCIIATAEFGGQHLLRQWNKVCVENNIHFLPVLIQDMIGYIGPLVIPGETACLECLRARQNSNMIDSHEKRIAEEFAFAGQHIAALHPSMLAVVAETAVFEFNRFYAGLLDWKVGKLIEINLFATSTTVRKVFKIPRCPVCSPLHNGVPTNVRKSIPLPKM